jgi:putative inorganic carbon (hco3(-)) transporter
MSVTALAWALLASVLLVMSVRRPIWAVALYMQTYFAAPHLWWWGRDIPQARYALWAGVLLLVVTAVSAQSREDGETPRMGSHTAAIFMIVNATLVHLVLAVNRTISLNTYIELLKYSLLFYLMHSAIRNRRDFRTALAILAVGGLYIGFEITVNDRGDISGARLEGVGAPGADTSNGLASLMLTILPLAGSLWVQGTRQHKALALASAPLILNVLLLCNSRGAFLGLIGAGVAFLILARGQARKKAFKTLALGAVALFLLLGDPKILDRFQTTFVGGEQRDNSAESRLMFWQAGMRMIADYPLGAGGAAFKEVLGKRYLATIIGDDAEARSLHNGFLTEGTDWGVQGLAGKLAFFGIAFVALYRTISRCRQENRTSDALVGLSIWASGAGLLITCIFGSFLASEWTFWLVALAVRYSQLYATGEQGEAQLPAAEQPGVKAA